MAKNWIKPEPRVTTSGDQDRAREYVRQGRVALEQLQNRGQTRGVVKPEGGVEIEVRNVGGQGYVNVNVAQPGKKPEEEKQFKGIKFQLMGYKSKILTPNDIYDLGKGTFMPLVIAPRYAVGSWAAGEYYPVPQDDISYQYGTWNGKPLADKVVVGFETRTKNWFINWEGVGAKYGLIFLLANWKHYYVLKGTATSGSPAVMNALPGYWQPHWGHSVYGYESGELSYFSVEQAEGSFHVTTEDIMDQQGCFFTGDPVTEEDEQLQELTENTKGGVIRAGCERDNIDRSSFFKQPPIEEWESSHPIEWIYTDKELNEVCSSSWSPCARIAAVPTPFDYSRNDYQNMKFHPGGDNPTENSPFQKTYIILQHVQPNDAADNVNSYFDYMQKEQLVGHVCIPRNGWVKRTLKTNIPKFYYIKYPMQYYDDNYSRYFSGELGWCFSFLQQYGVIQLNNRTDPGFDYDAALRQFRLGVRYMYRIRPSEGIFDVAYADVFDPKVTVETPVGSQRVTHTMDSSPLEFGPVEPADGFDDPYVKISTGNKDYFEWNQPPYMMGRPGNKYRCYMTGDIVMPITYFYPRALNQRDQEQEGYWGTVWQFTDQWAQG